MPDTPGRITIAVHGGAGRIPEAERPAHRAGLEKSLEEGWRRLRSGESALTAVEAAVRVLEDDPAFDAGVGSVLRTDGRVELDASIMDGESREAGAVAGVRRVPHPITLARHILEKTPHVLVIADGAERLAREADLELCDPRDLVVPREERRLARILERQGAADSVGPAGTVGAVARDRGGHVAAATSTGGAPGSLPGRVGDSPVIGAGTLADDRWGGVSCTGLGENILRVTLAREVVRRLAGGDDAEAAARWATRYLHEETGGTCGVICLDAAGHAGAAYSTHWMGHLARSDVVS
ncbi:MAG: isoaspartyl peptidase/L-asparaginase family protein [Planctomycetota bacterium]|nr:isoaspartyl peptidase/L-asparaginase family protein [Planctomycetota bacterium]